MAIIAPFSDEELRSLIGTSHVPPESVDVLDALERTLGIRFPPLLRRIYLLDEETHLGPVCGFCHREQHFDFHAVRQRHFEFVSVTILEARERMLSQGEESLKVMKHVIPIGYEVNGSQICLDYHTHAEPIVVKVDSDFQLLARSFEEFMDRARPGRRAHYKRADAKIGESELNLLFGEMFERW